MTPRIAAGSNHQERFEAMALRPQHRHHDRAERDQLEQALGEIRQRLLAEHPLEPAPGDTLLNFGFSDSADQTSRCWIMLPAIAAIASISSGTPSAPSTA